MRPVEGRLGRRASYPGGYRGALSAKRQGVDAGVQLLVTGGGGFIGSHLVERLVRDGHRVRVIDNFTTGHRRNLQPFLDEIELVEEIPEQPVG
jgi:hypothetical protein